MLSRLRMVDAELRRKPQLCPCALCGRHRRRAHALSAQACEEEGTSHILSGRVHNIRRVCVRGAVRMRALLFTVPHPLRGYLVQGKAEEIQIVKLCERLDRFKSLAEAGTEAGERENAERMLNSTKEKLAALKVE
jgi:hypothetical protein